MTKWPEVRYFNSDEFDSPDAPGSGRLMDEYFISLLDQLRARVKFPLVITSGYRTLQHNAEVGGKSESAHTRGHAADIACLTSRQRFLIIKNALDLGITRIGIGSNFIHLDIDHELPPEVIWPY